MGSSHSPTTRLFEDAGQPSNVNFGQHFGGWKFREKLSTGSIEYAGEVFGILRKYKIQKRDKALFFSDCCLGAFVS